MNRRYILDAQAVGYIKGRAEAQQEMEFLCITRLEAAYRKGREDQKRAQHRYAWGKLFFVVFGAAFAAHFLWALITLAINFL